VNPDPGSQNNNQATPGILTGQPPLSHATASTAGIVVHDNVHRESGNACGDWPD
jgi:hypothetical protein